MNVAPTNRAQRHRHQQTRLISLLELLYRSPLRQLKGNEVLAGPSQEAVHISLHDVELDIAAALAFKVTEQSGQCGKLSASAFAGFVWAVVQRSLMGRATNMLTQSSGGVELAVTDVTLIIVAVPSGYRAPVHLLPVPTVILQKTLSDNATGVALTHSTINDVAVEISGIRAGRTLQVMGKARGGSKAHPTKWTANVGALVNTRLHVLAQILCTLEVAVARSAVPVSVMVLSVLVLLAVLFRTEGKIASLAWVIVGKMILLFLVLIAVKCVTGATCASLALVLPFPVVNSCHVLLTSAP